MISHNESDLRGPGIEPGSPVLQSNAIVCESWNCEHGNYFYKKYATSVLN
jgi:hypothetical protein